MSFLWHGLTEQGAQVPVQVDAQGRVIAVDGTPGVSNWERTGTTLSPAVPGDSVAIGSGNITLNADGSISTPWFVSTNIGAFAFKRPNENQQVSMNSGAESYSLPVSCAIQGINTSTNQNYFAIDYNGTAFFGNDGSNNPNITLNASGDVTFAGQVLSGGQIFSGFPSQQGLLRVSGASYADQGTNCIVVDGAGGQTASIKANGTATFAGVITGEQSAELKGRVFAGSTLTENSTTIGLSVGPTNGLEVHTDGTATFKGNITAPNVTFRSADPQFYVKRSKNKDAFDYVGPELDLLAEIARLEALVRHLYETLGSKSSASSSVVSKTVEKGNFSIATAVPTVIPSITMQVISNAGWMSLVLAMSHLSE